MEVAPLTAVNPTLVDDSAITDIAGEDFIGILSPRAWEEEGEGMRVVLMLHGMGQVGTGHMEIIGAGGAVVGKSRASVTAGIADEILLGVRRGR